MKAKLTDLCSIQYGFAFDSSAFTEDVQFMPIVRIRDVKRGFSQTYYSGSYPPGYIVHEGDLLIGMDGEFNIARWKSRDALLNQRVCKVTAKSGTDSEFLRLVLVGALKKIEDRTAFVTVKHLSAKELNKLVLDVPPYEEQVRIANTLTKLERIIAQRNAQLSALDELLKARFVEMFGDPKLNPHGYPVKQLSEYIRFLTSGSRGWARYCADDGASWFITIKNVKNCRISTDDMQPLNAPDNAEARRTRVQEGDLLISITADLGRTGVVSKEIADHGAYINQHLTCIRLNRETLDPLYVAFFMESEAGKEQFDAKNQSAVKAGLNFNSIKSLQLLVPPKRLQQEFVRFVSRVESAKSAVEKALGETQVLFDSLMQEYFGS